MPQAVKRMWHCAWVQIAAAQQACATKCLHCHQCAMTVACLSLMPLPQVSGGDMRKTITTLQVCRGRGALLLYCAALRCVSWAYGLQESQ